MKKIISKYKVFLKYMIFAGISFLLDISLFHVFKYLLKDTLLVVETLTLVSTYVARAISSLFNYMVNRNSVFKRDDGTKASKKTIFEYYALVVIQATVSGLVVGTLTKHINIDSTLIKVPVECIIFLVNFFVQRYYIFNENRKKIILPENLRAVLFGISTSFSMLVTLNRKRIVLVNAKYNNSIALLFLAIFLINFYKKYNNKYKKNPLFTILAMIFSILMVVGYSYNQVGNAYLVFGNVAFISISILKFICYTILFDISINIVYEKLCNYEVKEKVKKSKLVNMFNKHPFIFSFITMLICFLPYYIIFYPAIMGFDPSNQIKEVMGIHNRYWDSVIMIDPNVTITNFNPVIHTLLLGGCFKLGYSIGNVNFGLFLYVVIQSIIYLSVLAYSISYMKKQGVSNKLLFIVLAMYSLIPVFPFYALSTNKDTIFCAFILLYCIKLYDVIANKQSIKNYVIFFFVMVMVCLTRNNGVYTIVLSLPFALIWLKDKRKPILACLLLVVSFYVCYNKVILPACKISNTSTREMLSLPFQQTARLAKYHPESFSEEDKEIIDKILDYDSLASKYNSQLSDPVKNQYDIYTTKEDLYKYFGVWAKGLTKHPDVYMDSTISNVYGYFYPNTDSWYLYYKYNTKLKEAGFDYHYITPKVVRGPLVAYGVAYPYIPIFGLFVNIGFVGWIYFFLFTALIVKKEYKYIPFVLPAITFILVCVAGPANTYFRYALPYIMPLPMTICLLYYIFHKKESIN